MVVVDLDLALVFINVSNLKCVGLEFAATELELFKYCFLYSCEITEILRIYASHGTSKLDRDHLLRGVRRVIVAHEIHEPLLPVFGCLSTGSGFYHLFNLSFGELIFIFCNYNILSSSGCKIFSRHAEYAILIN